MCDELAFISSSYLEHFSFTLITKTKTMTYKSSSENPYIHTLQTICFLLETLLVAAKS